MPLKSKRVRQVPTKRFFSKDDFISKISKMAKNEEITFPGNAYATVLNARAFIVKKSKLKKHFQAYSINRTHKNLKRIL